MPAGLQGKALWLVVQVAGAEALFAGCVDQVACKRVAPVLTGLCRAGLYDRPAIGNAQAASPTDANASGSHLTYLHVYGYSRRNIKLSRGITNGKERKQLVEAEKNFEHLIKSVRSVLRYV